MYPIHPYNGVKSPVVQVFLARLDTTPNPSNGAAASAKEPLAEVVRAKLRDEILEGLLAPGQRIRQEELAERFGVSRIPVREALRLLESEGLVTLIPHAGARVARFDVAELDEIYLLRERLEPLAIAQSVSGLSDENLDLLRSCHADIEAAAARDDLATWVALDREFHLATYAGVALPRLQSLIRECWNATQQYRRIYSLLADRVVISHIEHQLLLEALGRKDADDCERILTMHIRRTRLALRDDDNRADRFEESV
jgi:DNA-binding GntR family transcriptional regulator